MQTDEQDVTRVIENLKSAPNFDGSLFYQLIEDTSATVALKILARFKVSLEEALTIIHQGLEQDNSEVVWKACHKLVGSAELVGFKQFGEKSRKLDSDVKAMPDLQAHARDLEVYLQEGQQLISYIASSFQQWQSYL